MMRIFPSRASDLDLHCLLRLYIKNTLDKYGMFLLKIRHVFTELKTSLSFFFFFFSFFFFFFFLYNRGYSVA